MRLQLRGDFEDRRQASQVSRHGLLRGDQREGLVLYRVALLIDVPVTLDDAVSPGEILLLEGLNGLGDGTLGHGTQSQYLVLQSLQVMLELFPWHCNLLTPIRNGP